MLHFDHVNRYTDNISEMGTHWDQLTRYMDKYTRATGDIILYNDLIARNTEKLTIATSVGNEADKNRYQRSLNNFKSYLAEAHTNQQNAKKELPGIARKVINCACNSGVLPQVWSHIRKQFDDAEGDFDKIESLTHEIQKYLCRG